MKLPCTPSQTVGPYFEIGMSKLCSSRTYMEGAEGQRITICGHLFDGEGVAIPDAQLEFWQADCHGTYAGMEGNADHTPDKKCRRFARVATDVRGSFSLQTILPGCTAGPRNSLQAPHLAVLIFFRGGLRQLLTRVYFEGEAANEKDFILNSIPQDRRHTLIAKQMADKKQVFLWDVHMQGDEETVFFAC